MISPVSSSRRLHSRDAIFILGATSLLVGFIHIHIDPFQKKPNSKKGDRGAQGC
jgi:hypothetical protein